LIGWLSDATPAKVSLRGDVIEAIGLLKVSDAVPALLPILDKRDRESEAERGAVVVALGRIGDARAVEPLVKQFEVSYSTVVVYWIQGAIDAALRSITGVPDVVGANEWKAWNQRRRM
jgi:HEAT repeat protein